MFDINEVPGVNWCWKTLLKRRKFKLDLVGNPDSMVKFKAATERMIEQIPDNPGDVPDDY